MIRLVTADPAFALGHRDGLVALLRATVGNGAPLGFLHPLSESDAREYWDGVIASLHGGKRVVVVALDDDHVVGSAQIELASKQNAGHRAEVQKVSVLADYRNRGVGRMLMEEIESEARRLGRTLLLLDTREGGYAERFYESLGWTRAGRIPGYFYDETGTLHATIIFHKTIAEGTAVPSSQRFTNRVDDYVRGRPGYPPGVATLASRFGLVPSWTIADVGAGTGISAAMLLEAGCSVIAVEPNAAMRGIATARLGANPRFRAVDAAAESTTLPDRSVDAVFAAQAFHWFGRARFRAECLRILKPRGTAALIWNIRKAEASPFAAAYEALIREFATDYLKVRHENVSEQEIASFFGAPHERHDFDNVQVLDRDGLRARLVSSSYVPGAGMPRHDAMVAALDRLFEEHEISGVVELPYDASLFVGRPA
jgi:ribosomal protein S18 acetylase RimI-like enzyme/SAM-dependent methyltransferase